MNQQTCPIPIRMDTGSEQRFFSRSDSPLALEPQQVEELVHVL
jgi:hypothetical protein